MDIQLSHYLHNCSHKPKRSIKLPRISNNNSTLSNQSQQSMINQTIFNKMKNIVDEKRKSISQTQLLKKQIKFNASSEETNEEKTLNDKREVFKYTKINNTKNNKLRRKSWLDKVLEQKSDFAKHYFGEIEVTRQRIRQKTFDRTFPDLRIGEWTVKGYIYEGFLILKAKNGTYEISRKFQFQKVESEIRKSYQKWVHSKFKK